VSRRPCANPTTPGDTNCPFFSEAHLCANFAEPLLEALTDTGTTIKREVQVRHIGVSSRDRVDYVVWINGHPIPVEVKQNVSPTRSTPAIPPGSCSSPPAPTSVKGSTGPSSTP
jgi:hypothetical protein